MDNEEMADLNFRQLLDYGGQPIVRSTYDPPLKCAGYCIDCEQKDVFANAGDGFDQMSHGCDTSDYEFLLGKQTFVDKISIPIMFLLENPGGNYRNGEVVQYKGYKKQPPVNTYYWAPENDKWPEDSSNLPHFYSPYFAYLMKKHRLSNVYITNSIKCNIISSRKTEYNREAAESICVDKWLKREMEIFVPKVVFCFGRASENIYAKYANKYNWNAPSLYLYHPNAIYLSQRYNKTQKQMIDENDNRIENCIEKNA